MTKLSEFESFYVEFCIQNDLFMNFHIHHKANEWAADDDIFISVIESLKERGTGLSPFEYGQTRAHLLAKHINQIKEEYATARLLLVQSQHRTSEFDNISRRTLLANCHDYSRFDIYSGLLKSAFQLSYNILDKIASFVNTYLDIGFPEKAVQFKKEEFWVEQGEFRTRMLETENLSLYALFDIYKDFGSNAYSRIVSIRNALTHRKLTPYTIVLQSDMNKLGEEEIEMDEMMNKTIEMVKLSKFAVIYLVNFVNTEERKRIPDGKITLPMQINTDQYF
ncbi:hypothetical protein IT157_08035 [bacterium]|nr:hypothetical protein [bacterium]